MHMLYDSESFVVVHMLTEHEAGLPLENSGNSDISAENPSAHLLAAGSSDLARLPRHGFEIVDKRSGKEVFLDGAWAELFQQEMRTWEEGTVSQDDIEATLERYAELAQNPVLLH